MAGFYGGYLGNEGALNSLIAGGPSLPFGGGQQYRQIQQENRPGAPKPTGTSPTKIFPPNAPGREGAIDVQFRQALGNYTGAPGNILGMQTPSMLANSQFYMGPQLGQIPPGF